MQNFAVRTQPLDFPLTGVNQILFPQRDELRPQFSIHQRLCNGKRCRTKKEPQYSLVISINLIENRKK